MNKLKLPTFSLKMILEFYCLLTDVSLQCDLDNPYYSNST